MTRCSWCTTRSSTAVQNAVSVDEAVAAAERRCPDLITADVDLRPGSGITAVQTICAAKPVPALFITGSPAEVRIRMPGHLLVEKPFSATHIAAATKLTLGMRHG